MKVLTFGFNLSLLKFVYFEQKGGFNELNLRLWFILVTADKVGMNRTLNLGLLGLLPLRLCRLLGGVVVIGRLLLTKDGGRSVQIGASQRSPSLTLQCRQCRCQGRRKQRPRAKAMPRCEITAARRCRSYSCAPDARPQPLFQGQRCTQTRI